MTTQNELLLEHRVSELELELNRLRKLIERQAQQPAATAAPARYTHPSDRPLIHEKRTYEFFAKLPETRRVVDFLSRNKATNELVHIGYFSPLQIERACQKFSRLTDPTRKLWKGNTRLYSVARRLFAQHGAIQQHKGSRVWHWAIWPHERRECAAMIVAGLSPKN